ncbi:MAG: mannitol dehydrogenase family protein [Clostridiaceae bacterium]|nr:mannitol dehydrogenase family protein [Clostridiaceae bacterium]MDY5015409.1 mannitol dehydrogenase family protein [Eubacteriales bacterium]
MSTLNQALLKDSSFWEGKGALLPKYDREKLPVTAICFSMGRMGFGHFADIMQDLLECGAASGVIAGVETFSRAYYDSLKASDMLVTQIIYGNKKGEATPKIQGAITRALFLEETTESEDWQELLSYARDERVQFATINAPEIVYGMTYSGGDFATPTAPKVIADMENGTYTSDPGKWARFLLERYNAGLKFAVVSCTNFSRNGFFTGAVLRTMARAWEEKGYAPKGFLAYLSDPSQVGFPNTMIDRIAVSPDDVVRARMAEMDLESSVVVTEENRYWAIEDVFPGGRPAFDRAKGVFMCPNFADVKKYEDMKLRVLNMSHTTFASLGVLLGNRGAYGIYKCMQDKTLVDIITKIMDIVRGVIERPAAIDPADFIADTFDRLNNPNIPDDPMRIALNASTKITPRLMETYWEARERGVCPCKLSVILKPVAGFLRYCAGVDDAGVEYKLEDDPIRDTLVACGEAAKSGVKAEEAFRPLLSNASVFGRDLYTEPEVLSELCRLTDAMFAGPGAVRAAIDA